ncbi:MAG: hypothetical protein WAM97_12435 [Acidimicrobiales bacterium]
MTAPYAVRVGVTGHLNFEREKALELSVKIEMALERVRTFCRPSPDRLVVFTAVSALAEGADRLVAKAVLSTRGGRLEAVLPFEEGIYTEDFTSEQSKREFHMLCREASSVTLAPPMPESGEDDTEVRNNRYEWAGRFVVDHSDVLLALWNGRPSQGTGGTAEIVLYALQRSKPVFYIPTEGGELVEYLGEGEVHDAFRPTGIFDAY